MRKLIVGIIALVTVVSFGGVKAYPTSPCNDGAAETHESDEHNVTNPVTGGHVYAARPDQDPTTGYAGNHGTTGYAEVSYDLANRRFAVEGMTRNDLAGASVHGGSHGETVGVCVTVNGTTVHQDV